MSPRTIRPHKRRRSWRVEDCSHTPIAYNSCRNRHCPKCQGSQARAWLEERKAELLGVPYFHVVFTLPARIGAIAYQNKAVIYDLLFKASARAHDRAGWRDIARRHTVDRLPSQISPAGESPVAAVPPPDA